MLIMRMIIDSSTFIMSWMLIQNDTFTAPKTPAQSQSVSKSFETDDIMKTLLAHEKTVTTAHVPAGVATSPPSDEESSTSESDDEAMTTTNKAAISLIGTFRLYTILFKHRLLCPHLC